MNPRDKSTWMSAEWVTPMDSTHRPGRSVHKTASDMAFFAGHALRNTWLWSSRDPHRHSFSYRSNFGYCYQYGLFKHIHEETFLVHSRCYLFGWDSKNTQFTYVDISMKEDVNTTPKLLPDHSATLLLEWAEPIILLTQLKPRRSS